MENKPNYEQAFLHVKSTISDNKQVTIGSSLNCFINPNISDKLKGELGLMIIAMIFDQKKRNVLNVPSEALSKIVEKIIEDMPEP
tara:strand:- start:434 stop:688 length:255 start_codon:yes stop_codon:yes gene_type:complete